MAFLRTTPVALLVMLGSQTKVAHGSGASSSGIRACTIATTAEVAEHAQQMCGETLVAEALRAVDLQPAAAAETAELLAQHSIRTARDLQLLDEDAAELLAELKGSGVAIGDRARIRLLIGYGERHRDIRIPWSGKSESSARQGSRADGMPNEIDAPRRRSRLQEDTGSESGVSFDTVAIVLSVLVGAAGCASTLRRNAAHACPAAVQI